MLSNSPSVQGAHLIRAATLVSATSVCRLGVDQSVSEASNHRRVISYRPCDPQYTTVAYTAISMLCMAILSGLVGGYITQRRWHALMWPGYRLRQLERKQLKRMRFPHVLLCLLYVFSIGFVFSAAMAKIGLGLATHGACRAAIYLCFVFYIASKVIM